MFSVNNKSWFNLYPSNILIYQSNPVPSSPIQSLSSGPILSHSLVPLSNHLSSSSYYTLSIHPTTSSVFLSHTSSLSCLNGTLPLLPSSVSLPRWWTLFFRKILSVIGCQKMKPTIWELGVASSQTSNSILLS